MVRLKMIFIILFISQIPGSVYSQNFNAQMILGLNVSQVDGDSYGGYNQPGLLTGISVYRKPNDKYNYGFELLFSQKGSHKKTTEDAPTVFRLRYTYICMPLFVDLKKLGSSLDNVTVRLGISNNFNIVSKVDFGYGWNDNDIRPYELSGIVGVGYKFKEKFGFMIRHENSILSIGNPPSAPSQYYRIGRGLRNRLFSFVFSYDL